MAVETMKYKKLSVQVIRGTTPEGKIISQTTMYPGLDSTATSDGMYAAARALGGLVAGNFNEAASVTKIQYEAT